MMNQSCLSKCTLTRQKINNPAYDFEVYEVVFQSQELDTFSNVLISITSNQLSENFGRIPLEIYLDANIKNRFASLVDYMLKLAWDAQLQDQQKMYRLYRLLNTNGQFKQYTQTIKSKEQSLKMIEDVASKIQQGTLQFSILLKPYYQLRTDIVSASKIDDMLVENGEERDYTLAGILSIMASAAGAFHSEELCRFQHIIFKLLDITHIGCIKKINISEQNLDKSPPLLTIRKEKVICEERQKSLLIYIKLENDEYCLPKYSEYFSPQDECGLIKRTIQDDSTNVFTINQAEFCEIRHHGLLLDRVVQALRNLAKFDPSQQYYEPKVRIIFPTYEVIGNFCALIVECSQLSCDFIARDLIKSFSFSIADDAHLYSMNNLQDLTYHDLFEIEMRMKKAKNNPKNSSFQTAKVTRSQNTSQNNPTIQSSGGIMQQIPKQMKDVEMVNQSSQVKQEEEKLQPVSKEAQDQLFREYVASVFSPDQIEYIKVSQSLEWLVKNAKSNYKDYLSYVESYNILNESKINESDRTLLATFSPKYAYYLVESRNLKKVGLKKSLKQELAQRKLVYERILIKLFNIEEFDSTSIDSLRRDIIIFQVDKCQNESEKDEEEGNDNDESEEREELIDLSSSQEKESETN